MSAVDADWRPQQPRPTRPSPPEGLDPWVAALGLVAAWAVVLVASSLVVPSEATFRVALFVHLVALVVGFGSVLVLDVHGVLWLVRRRTLTDLVRLTDALTPLVWVGFFGLLVSGVFLEPNLAVPRTALKVVLVLVAGLNGLWAHQLSRRLATQQRTRGPDQVDQGLLARVMASGGISQTAWWGATLIGLLNTSS